MYNYSILFICLVYFVIGCYTVHYIHNGRIYPGSKILIVVRDPLETFNPFFEAAPAITLTTTRPPPTTASISTSPTIDTTALFDITEPQESSQPPTTEAQKSTQPPITEPQKSTQPPITEPQKSTQPPTTEPQKSTQPPIVELQKSTQPPTTEECSSCDGNCVLSHYRCTSDSNCPPCYNCYSDDYHIYKICKHVNRGRTTLGIFTETTEKYGNDITTRVEVPPEVENLETTVHSGNQKREDQNLVSTVIAQSSTITPHVTTLPSSTQDTTTTTSLPLTRHEAATSTINFRTTNVPNTVISSSGTTLADTVAKNVTTTVPAMSTTELSGSKLPVTTGVPILHSTTFETTTSDSTDTTWTNPIPFTTRSSPTTLVEYITPGTTLPVTLKTLRTTTITPILANTTTSTTEPSSSEFSVTSMAPKLKSTTYETTTFTPTRTTNVAKTTTESTVSIVQSTTRELTTTFANNITSNTTLPVTFTTPGNTHTTTNLENIATGSTRYNEVKVLITSLAEVVASVLTNWMTRMLNSSSISDVNNNVAESTRTSTEKQDATIHDPINTTQREIFSTSRKFTEATTQRTTSSGTVDDFTEVPTTFKPSFPVTESTTPAEVDTETRLPNSNTQFDVTTVFTSSRIVPVDVQTTITPPKPTTTGSSKIVTVPTIITTTVSGTTSKATEGEIKENQSTMAVPINNSTGSIITTPATIPVIVVDVTSEEPTVHATNTTVPRAPTTTVPDITATNDTTIRTKPALTELITSTISSVSDVVNMTTVLTTDEQTKLIENTFSSIAVSTVPDSITSTIVPSVNASGTVEAENKQTSITVSSIAPPLPTSLLANDSVVTTVSSTLRVSEDNGTTIKENIPVDFTTTTAKIVMQTEGLLPLLTTISNKTATLKPPAVSTLSNTDVSQITIVAFSTPQPALPTTSLIHTTMKSDEESSGDDSDVFSGSGERILEEYDDDREENRPRESLNSLKEENGDNDITMD